MKLYLLSFLLFQGIISMAQNDAEKIFWIEDGLTWNDFQGNVDNSSPFNANTNAGLSFAWGVKNDNGVIELTYEVTSYFNPGLSWVKKDSYNDHLLRHEQLHFDITELHARKLRKKVAEINISQLGKDPRIVITRVYQSVEKERSAMQQKFDRESKHNLDKDAEARWQQFVRAELKKYPGENT